MSATAARARASRARWVRLVVMTCLSSSAARCAPRPRAAPAAATAHVGHVDRAVAERWLGSPLRAGGRVARSAGAHGTPERTEYPATAVWPPPDPPARHRSRIRLAGHVASKATSTGARSVDSDGGSIPWPRPCRRDPPAIGVHACARLARGFAAPVLDRDARGPSSEEVPGGDDGAGERGRPEERVCDERDAAVEVGSVERGFMPELCALAPDGIQPEGRGAELGGLLEPGVVERDLVAEGDAVEVGVSAERGFGHVADVAEAGVDEVGVVVESAAFEAGVALEPGLVEEGVAAEPATAERGGAVEPGAHEGGFPGGGESVEVGASVEGRLAEVGARRPCAA